MYLYFALEYDKQYYSWNEQYQPYEENQRQHTHYNVIIVHETSRATIQEPSLCVKITQNDSK